MKKFDFVVGNPPYQEEAKGTSTSDDPVYHLFMESSYKVGEKVELITPARFLFNAGKTPKKWNQQMLNDAHFKVLKYYAKSESIFNNVDIKGGVVITYRDITKQFSPIIAFTAFPELNSINNKVNNLNEGSLSDVISNRGLYRFSDIAYEEQPLISEIMPDPRISSPSFKRLPELFLDDKPNNNYDYIQIYGILNGKRCYKWFRKDYLKDVENLYKYKVLIPKANGSGAIGEGISTPLVGTPLVGFTETFISIGETDSREEAEATLKYVKTKFARAMLGILKITQDNTKSVWKYVPIQDFTENSDIDWSKSIADIDQQLYKKYGLSPEEIDFIEEKVQEME